MVACVDRQGVGMVYDAYSGDSLTAVPAAVAESPPVFSKDGKRFYITTRSGVRVYDTNNWRHVATFPDATIRSAQSIDDAGKHLVAHDGLMVAIWNTEDHGPLSSFIAEREDDEAIIDPTGRWIATWSKKGNAVVIRDVEYGKERLRMHHPSLDAGKSEKHEPANRISIVQFDQTGESCLVGWDNAAVIVDLTSSTIARRIDIGDAQGAGLFKRATSLEIRNPG
jgi:hypothetical protein